MLTRVGDDWRDVGKFDRGNGARGHRQLQFELSGGWLLGSRLDGPGPVGPSSQLFFHRMAACGLAVAPIDYRLSSEATHPAHLDDVVAACEFLATHGAYLKIDDLPLTLWGVSYGAHLAGLAALASPVGDRIVGVASWSAPSDLAAFARRPRGHRRDGRPRHGVARVHVARRAHR